MLNKNNFKDFIIVNRDGNIIYADIGNPQYFKGGLESFKGKSLKSLYKDIDDVYPTIRAAREGIANDYFEMNITTSRGVKLKKIGCTYPIFMHGEPIAAIEFADYFYDKIYIGTIDDHADHLIYRGNNTKYIIDDIITHDKKMKDIISEIDKFAITDSTILIYGETGTGKELVAQAIHNSSRRYSQKFISINCGAIPNTLLESLIFGTTKGSFTGAEDKAGLFEMADKGTLFLDEINSLDSSLQIKLLEAIETKKIRRIGSNKEIKFDIKIVAASNENPLKLIKEGRMKPDLYYRLAVIYVRLPKLKDRGDDIILLADYFVNYFNNKMNLKIKPISNDIKNKFMNYSWPGNVRELRNTIEGAFAFAENNQITLKEIPKYIVSLENSKTKNIRPITAHGDENKIYIHDSINKKYSLNESVDLLESSIIILEYKKHRENLTETAASLKISKQLLRYKLSKYYK